MYKKEDFFMTGSAQSAIIYNYSPAIGALNSMGAQDTGILIYLNGVVSFYFAKEGITNYKEELIKKDYKYFQERFNTWLIKWQQYVPEFKQLATEPQENWHNNWQRLENLSKEYWHDSYFLDVFDHFAEDFEANIKQALKKEGVEVIVYQSEINLQTEEIVCSKQKNNI